MDNGIPDWKGETALVTTNNFNAGEIAGEYLKTVLKDGDTIGILEGVPGVPALDDRVNGMLQGLEGVEGRSRRQGRAPTAPRNWASSVAEDLLTAHPDLKAIYAACGPPAVGATQAIENAGIANDAIVMVGFDACCGEIDKIVSPARKTPRLPSSPPRWANSASTRWSRPSRAKRLNRSSTPAPALVTKDNVADFE